MYAAADVKPSAEAVSLISPGLSTDCTMTCARPLNTLRCHFGISAFFKNLNVTPSPMPPDPSRLLTATAMVLSPTCNNGLMSKLGEDAQSRDSPTSLPLI